ncbi:hypothetical protein [Bacillus cereus]|uniref:hypothetical protein n=1 Tax=Bacillus cereus TaxID=1396 RepID=UPI004041C49B
MCGYSGYDGGYGPNRFYYPQRFVEGDNISIMSGGNFIGRGSFLRIDGCTLIWCDRGGNINFTDLRVSSIKKVVCCEEGPGFGPGVSPVDDCAL